MVLQLAHGSSVLLPITVIRDCSVGSLQTRRSASVVTVGLHLKTYPFDIAVIAALPPSAFSDGSLRVADVRRVFQKHLSNFFQIIYRSSPAPKRNGARREAGSSDRHGARPLSPG